MATVDVTQENLRSLIEDSEFAIFDFWAPWCGPCQSFGPVFEQTSEKYPDIVFAKVNTEEQQEIAGFFGIRSIPTLMVFREQVLVYNNPGALQASQLEELIRQVGELDMEKVKQEIAEQEAKQGQQGE